MIGRFLSQPVRAHRDAVLVLGSLAAVHVAVGVAAAVAPFRVMGVFRRAGAPMGHTYLVSEFSHFWRAIAAVHLLMLGAALLAIALDARRNAPLTPLVVGAKVAIGAMFAFVWAAGRFAPHTMLGFAYGPFLGFAIGEWLLAAIVLFVALRARRALATADPADLVPRTRRPRDP